MNIGKICLALVLTITATFGMPNTLSAYEHADESLENWMLPVEDFQAGLSDEIICQSLDEHLMSVYGHEFIHNYHRATETIQNIEASFQRDMNEMMMFPEYFPSF